MYVCICMDMDMDVGVYRISRLAVGTLTGEVQCFVLTQRNRGKSTGVQRFQKKQEKMLLKSTDRKAIHQKLHELDKASRKGLSLSLSLSLSVALCVYTYDNSPIPPSLFTDIQVGTSRHIGCLNWRVVMHL